MGSPEYGKLHPNAVMKDLIARKVHA